MGTRATIVAVTLAMLPPKRQPRCRPSGNPDDNLREIEQGWVERSGVLASEALLSARSGLDRRHWGTESAVGARQPSTILGRSRCPFS